MGKKWFRKHRINNEWEIRFAKLEKQMKSAYRIPGFN